MKKFLGPIMFFASVITAQANSDQQIKLTSIPKDSTFTFLKSVNVLPNTSKTRIDNEENQHIYCNLSHNSNVYDRIINAGTVYKLVTLYTYDSSKVEFKLVRDGDSRLMIECIFNSSANDLESLSEALKPTIKIQMSSPKPF